MKKNSNATPMPVPPQPFLSIQTLISASINLLVWQVCINKCVLGVLSDETKTAG